MTLHQLTRLSHRALSARHASLILLLPVVLACSLPGLVKKAVEESQKPVTIKSSDSRIQMTVPGGWREEKKLNETAILQAGHRFQEMYVVVIEESKKDYVEDATIDYYAGLSRETMIEAVQEPQATDPIPISLGAYRAMEYVLDGSVDKIKVKYIVTAVETPNHFYQVVTWTLPSLFQKNQAKLREVTQSFKELRSE